MSLLTSLTRAWLTRSLRPFRFTDRCDGELSYREEERLGLYIHIPFCRALCAFCPYCKVVYNPELAQAYTEALLREIDLAGRRGGPEKKTVTSLYFGGGTPALLAGSIGRICEKIGEYFTVTEGVGVELHPQDVTPETLRLLRDAGVTKLSIGIQSFQPAHAAVLGRPPADPAQMHAALREIPFETVSMDFIFALPGQTIASIRQDIETAFSSGANHIALYPLIDFTFTGAKIPAMKRGEKKRLFYDVLRYCEDQGYERSTLWTFSKGGRSQYSSMTRESFLGFGCSAVTLLRDRFQISTFDPAAYMERIGEDRLPTALTLRFTRRQRMVYYLFWTAYGLRVDPAAFRAFFGEDLETLYGAELRAACMLGLAEKRDGVYVMTARGSYYYHYYEQFYTLSYIDQMWGLLGKTAFPGEFVIR